ncbi:MAG: DUF2953 domain-containing protein [Clostridia bacterium]|nr:DUF2953 domain-containing protein [Clostridia bacterium]
MNGWIIFGCILLFFWLIGMIRASVEVEYNTDVRVAVKVLGMTFRITPKEKKPLKLSDFTPKKYRKRLAKDEKLRLKQEAKKAKKQAEKERKKAEKKAAKEAAKKGLPPPDDGKKKKEKKKKELAEIMELVLVGLDAVKVLFKSFGKHFRIEAVRLKIAVGGEDAASTAILYGIVVQFVTYLCHALAAITNFKVRKPEEIAVTADFLSDKLTMDLHFVFRLRVWHIFAMVFAAGIGAVKRLLKNMTGDEPSPAKKIADTQSTDSPAG